MIVAGERRFRASKIAEKKTIRAIIKDFSDAEVKEIALLENIQRQDLNPIETARALKELGDTFGWTQEALADRLGKSRSVIANTLRLLTLCPEVIDLIESHMGQWDYFGKFPTPKSSTQKFVHLCDFLASRKEVSVEVMGRE